MSFWNGVKRAFGFEPEYDEEDLTEDYAPATPQSADIQPAPVPVVPPALTAVTPSETTPGGTSDSDPTLPADLFDAVLEVFNSAQPDFIRRCLSTQAQREYLLGVITDKLHDRLKRATHSEATPVDEELRQECEQLRIKCQDTEKLRKENRKLRLSLANQKRALQDRIGDLETQLETANDRADKAMRSRREQQPKDVVETVASEAETIADSQTAPGAAPADEARTATLMSELNRQTLLREQAEMKSRMADRMVTDMRNEVAATRRELEESTAEQEEAVKLVQEKFDEFEQLKRRLDTRIRELQEALKQERSTDRESRIASLSEENASLRHTIETNLYNQANSEMRLRKEIKALRSEIETLRSNLPAAAAESPALPYTDVPVSGRRRGRPKKQHIDPSLSSTDCFAIDPADTPPTRKATKDDPDFGYHEPTRRPSNDNEAQLTLF